MDFSIFDDHEFLDTEHKNFWMESLYNLEEYPNFRTPSGLHLLLFRRVGAFTIRRYQLIWRYRDFALDVVIVSERPNTVELHKVYTPQFQHHDFTDKASTLVPEIPIGITQLVSSAERSFDLFAANPLFISSKSNEVL